MRKHLFPSFRELIFRSMSDPMIDISEVFLDFVFENGVVFRNLMLIVVWMFIPPFAGC